MIDASIKALVKHVIYVPYLHILGNKARLINRQKVPPNRTFHPAAERTSSGRTSPNRQSDVYRVTTREESWWRVRPKLEHVRSWKFLYLILSPRRLILCVNNVSMLSRTSGRY